MNLSKEQAMRQKPEEQVFERIEAPGDGRRTQHNERGARRVVETLRYLSAHGEEAGDAEDFPHADGGPESAWEARLAQSEAEWRLRLEAVRKDALMEGRAQAEGDRMALLRQCAGQWEHAVKEFAQTRDHYFARVEREVVELSLAIASRILQRETQVDPLLLAGAVRVALGQLSETTTVELHVPARTHEMWSEMLRLMPNLPVIPTLVAGSEMKDGECVLTTEVGRVDLSVHAQLKEIERGFLDLLSHRAPVAARETSNVGL